MRIRSIKPEFWTSEAIARLPWSARLLFIALWSYVDDNGVGRDNERLVVADVFPLEEDYRETLATVSRDLQTLATEGRIVRYTADGKAWLAIVNWDEHQKIDRPAKARYPGPEKADKPLTCADGQGTLVPRDSLATVSRQSRDSASTGTGEQGNRGTGEKGKNPSARSASVEAPGFAEFYAAYPRHVGRRVAASAYERALRRTTADVILAGAQRMAADPNLPETDKIPHPTTWLNRDGWGDDPYPVRLHTDNRRSGDDAAREAHEVGQRYLARQAAAGQPLRLGSA